MLQKKRHTARPLTRGRAYYVLELPCLASDLHSVITCHRSP